jgi:hypothetical protein
VLCKRASEVGEAGVDGHSCGFRLLVYICLERCGSGWGLACHEWEEEEEEAVVVVVRGGSLLKRF